MSKVQRSILFLGQAWGFSIGTVEWGCNVYRFRGTNSGCTCSSCPNGQVIQSLVLSCLFTPGKTKFSTAINGAIKIFTVAAIIVVVAVPERLPLVVTLT
ncbi:hypothetical protein RHMOL_Rhmol04G0206900 [Rhododendron molle]|uniref:Uncharacterized protein n=1 Tax=Rhododendron molle TaxID=49168 RepID=A0ACC0P4E2_RHOML|nr:hypothetical protein RHMOL_Rhmol04G0206900 [Rhododendron molle]